jgi:hypothetical protein
MDICASSVQLDRLAGHPHETARIDRKETDVGARGRGDRVARGGDDGCRRLRAEDVVDRIIDPLAEHHDRFAASAYAAHHLREAHQRAEHLLRPMSALEIVGIRRDVRVPIRSPYGPRFRRARWRVRVVGVRSIELELFQVLGEILVGLLEDRRPQLASAEFVDRGEQEGALGRELLGAFRPAARVRDRRHVVGGEVPLDELTRRVDDDLCPQRAHVEIVEHDHIQAAANRLRVGSHIADRRYRRARTRPRRGQRDVDHRERVDLLQPALVEQLEIILGEI